MEIISGHQRAVPSVSREPDGVDGVRDYLSGLRQSINGHLLNVGVLSAFMSSLAASVYVGMPQSPQCLGADAVKVAVTLQWFSMGSFFLAITATVLLASDLAGVPDLLLIEHLRGSLLEQALPSVLAGCGLWLMAIGYGIDLGERNGCAWSVVGIGAAPLFPAVVSGFLFYLRSKRRRLNKLLTSRQSSAHPVRLGGSLFNTWYDCVPRRVEAAPTDSLSQIKPDCLDGLSFLSDAAAMRLLARDAIDGTVLMPSTEHEGEQCARA